MNWKDKDKLIESLRNITKYTWEIKEKLYYLDKAKKNIEEVIEKYPDKPGDMKKRIKQAEKDAEFVSGHY